MDDKKEKKREMVPKTIIEGRGGEHHSPHPIPVHIYSGGLYISSPHMHFILK